MQTMRKLKEKDRENVHQYLYWFNVSLLATNLVSNGELLKVGYCSTNLKLLQVPFDAKYNHKQTLKLEANY